MKFEINKANIAKINKAAQEAFEVTVQQVSEGCDRELESDKWDWPRETLRKSGNLIPPGLRDIIDTGELLESKEVSVEGNDATIKWDCNHALITHDGATLRNGTEIIARPFTEVPVATGNDIFANELKERLK